MSYKSVDDDTLALERQRGSIRGFHAGLWAGFLIMAFLQWIAR